MTFPCHFVSLVAAAASFAMSWRAVAGTVAHIAPTSAKESNANRTFMSILHGNAVD
jgi:hypothetical protein